MLREDQDRAQSAGMLDGASEPGAARRGRDGEASPPALELLRQYVLAGPDGYPAEWHTTIKHLVRELDGHRCVRCGHPYRTGAHKMELDAEGEWVSWSPCDERCTHHGPVRWRDAALSEDARWHQLDLDTVGCTAAEAQIDEGPLGPMRRYHVEARWRVLTVHHLDGVKLNCRWWNLASLCQRCHLTIQKRVDMNRIWPWAHTEWFKPYAAGWYAWAYLREDLTREETLERLEGLLALERQA